MTASQTRPSGYVFWNSSSCTWLFFSKLNPPWGSLSQIFLFQPRALSTWVPFPPMGLTFFQEIAKMVGVCKGRQNKPHSHPLWISRADKAAPRRIDPDWWGSKWGVFVFVVVSVLSGRPNLARLTPSSPAESIAAGPAHRSTNPVQTEYLNCSNIVPHSPAKRPWPFISSVVVGLHHYLQAQQLSSIIHKANTSLPPAPLQLFQLLILKCQLQMRHTQKHREYRVYLYSEREVWCIVMGHDSSCVWW